MTVGLDPDISTDERSQEEQHVAETLAHLFIAGVVAAKAADWLGLARRWSDHGYSSDSFHREVSRKFTDVFWQSAGSVLVRAAGIGQGIALADFEIQVPQKKWNDMAQTWAQVYGHEMSKQVSQQSEKAISSLIPQLLNSGMRRESLALQAKALYGLDPRSMNGAMSFLKNDKKPRDKTVIDLTTQLLSQRAKIIGDVQSFTALNYGRQLTYMEAQDSGLLPKSARKVWVTAIDERVCPVCKPMDGRTVGLTDFFHVDKHRVLVPPVHPNCRCTIVPEERYKHGLITAAARFFDKGPPEHKGKLRQEIEDLVLSKNITWDEIKHPRDNKGQFARNAAETAAGLGLAVAAARSPAVRGHLNVLVKPKAAEAWEKFPSMRHFPAKVQLLRFNDPNINDHIKLLHDLEDETDIGRHQVLFHPDAYEHLQGANLQETLNKVEHAIKHRKFEHSAVVTPQGRIISMGRGSTEATPVWTPSTLPKGTKGQLVFTHNHPNEGVGAITQHTLSLTDVIAMQSHGIRRARAVTPNSEFYDMTLRAHANKINLGAFNKSAAYHIDNNQMQTIVDTLHDVHGLSPDEVENIIDGYTSTIDSLQKTGYAPPGPALDNYKRVTGMIVDFQAQMMHDLYQKESARPHGFFWYDFGNLSTPVAKFSPEQPRDDDGKFVAWEQAKDPLLLLKPSGLLKPTPAKTNLSRYHKGVDNRLKNLKTGTYILPRSYLEAHARGWGIRLGQKNHVRQVTNKLAQEGFDKKKPITLYVYNDAAFLRDGAHRLEAAYRLDMKKVPVRVVRIKSDYEPFHRGIGGWMNERKTERIRREVARRGKYTKPIDVEPRPWDDLITQINRRLIERGEVSQKKTPKVNVSVTGTTNLGDEHHTIVNRALDNLSPEKHRLVVGGARGADVVVAELARKRGFDVHAVLPSAAYHKDAIKHSTSNEIVPPGKNTSDSYMKRNDRLVELADQMIAFPKSDKEELRSGTWATIRRAKKANKPVRLYPLTQRQDSDNKAG